MRIKNHSFVYSVIWLDVDSCLASILILFETFDYTDYYLSRSIFLVKLSEYAFEYTYIHRRSLPSSIFTECSNS